MSSKLSASRNTYALLPFVPLFFFIFVFFVQFSQSNMATLGGVRQSRGCENSADVEDLARFAVQEHNKKENALLEFAGVLKAEEQVVAGTLHHLTLEAVEGGKKKIYEAKVWVKPWLNFKELQEFKHTGDGDAAPSFTRSDLGVKLGGHREGWQVVPTHDPVVQDAANHALSTLQRRSNSLFPYELQEVVHAKAEVIDNSAKFDMILKVKRGTKEEKYKAEVHKNSEGTFHLNQIEPDSS
uniref:Cysteine proteinase inhibitor n=1 Tax=Morus alba var. atropurpurea TaxID=1453101 RepID=A0A0B4ZYW5_MORAL|nr:CPI-1 [Morus alba var. atropurpurea]